MRTDFRHVKQEIRNRIVHGVWGPGDLLPNEVDLSEEFQCARATVNRAMRELAEEGLVERKRKAGTRVLMSPRQQAKFDIPVVRKEIEGRGAMYRYALVHKEVIDTPDWLRARLGLAEGGQVVHLVCMHFADGSPYLHEERWINLTALPQAASADFSALGPNEWLLEHIPFSDAEINFFAMPADESLARHLGCVPADSLFMSERSTWFEGTAVTHARLAFHRGYRMTSRF